MRVFLLSEINETLSGHTSRRTLTPRTLVNRRREDPSFESRKNEL